MVKLTKMLPNATTVKKMRPMGWADFKHKLFRAGILLTPQADVPQVWQDAFLKSFGKNDNQG